MIEPMKAVLADKPFSDPDWIFERKLDGDPLPGDRRRRRRPAAVAHRPRHEPRATPRSSRRSSASRRATSSSTARSSPSRRHHQLLAAPAARAASACRCSSTCSTCSRLDGDDLRALPLRERKALLRRALDFGGPAALHPAPQRRARRGALPRGLREGPRGRDRQARRQPLPSRRPLARLAQAQVPRRAGARDRRLHRAEGVAHRVRRAAGRLLRRRRAALRRQGRHRLRPRTRCASSAQPDARARARRPAVRALQADPAAARTGSSPSWWPRSASPSGRATAGCATRATSACATTSRRARSSARSRRERRDHPPGQGAVPRRRDHQGRPRRLLRARRPSGCCRTSSAGR